MTITEFLLARITEDEHRLDAPDFIEVPSAHGTGWGNRGDCPLCGYYQQDGNEVVTEEAWYDHADRAHQRKRVLAECQAKRAIIERHVARIGQENERGRPAHLFDPVLSMLVKDDRYVLAHLAAVYADHPDYDPSWRP